jgi:hypothetical protein
MILFICSFSITAQEASVKAFAAAMIPEIESVFIDNL